MNYQETIKKLSDHQLWCLAGELIGEDYTDHENDDEVKPVFEILKKGLPMDETIAELNKAGIKTIGQKMAERLEKKWRTT